jgi:alpha-glucosidase
MLILKKLILLLLCPVLLIPSCPAATHSASRVSDARISVLPNGIEVADGSSLLDVEILDDRIVNVHARVEGKSTPRTLVLDPKPVLRPPAIARSEQNGVYVISAPGISVHVAETKPYSVTFFDATGRQLLRSADPFGEARKASLVMQRAAGDTLYGIHGLGLNDTSGGLARNDGGKVAAGVQGNSGAPFVFSVRYGLLVDSDGGEFTADPGSIVFRNSSRPDVEYFVFAGAPLETMAALSKLVGPPPLPPKWTLGFLNSQWGSSEPEVKKIVEDYRQKQIPIDGFILDFDWKAWGEDNYGEWRWNSTSGPGNVAPDKFPDGASGVFAKELAAKGVKLAGILKPRILMTLAGNPSYLTGAAAYATDHHFWYPGEASYPEYFSHRMARDLDFNDAGERSWFWEHLLPAFRAGMVGWWNDEADVSGHDDVSKQVIFNNFEFLNMGRMLYEGQRKNSETRVWSINRDFYLGASRYGYAGWSGDIDSGFASMALQRVRMLAAVDTGEFHWSMDTGGFHGHPTPENYARWIEFAAFVPIMRVHGELDEKRQPWVYGPTAEAAARQAIDLRYELMPYIYSYEHLTTEGAPGLVHPLFWEFPSDREAAAQDGEWMFGDALLVAPIVSEGATSKTIYLPAGEWFDYASGRSYQGAQNIEISADAKTWKDIPVFVRSGSIVATQPLEQYVGQRPVREVTLDIFPSESCAAFTAYDDDGETYNYEKGEYLRQEITVLRKGGEIQVTIDAATGSYASPLRTFLLKIHAAAQGVTLNGKQLPGAGSSPASLSTAANWVHEDDRFGTVIELRVTAGARALSNISLR